MNSGAWRPEHSPTIIAWGGYGSNKRHTRASLTTSAVWRSKSGGLDMNGTSVNYDYGLP